MAKEEVIEVKNVSAAPVSLSCGTEISPKSSVRLPVSAFARSAHWARSDMRLFIKGEGDGDNILCKVSGSGSEADRAFRGTDDAPKGDKQSGKAGKAGDGKSD